MSEGEKKAAKVVELRPKAKGKDAGDDKTLDQKFDEKIAQTKRIAAKGEAVVRAGAKLFEAGKGLLDELLELEDDGRGPPIER